MKCRNCKKQITYFEVFAQHAVNPITCEIGDLKRLLGFFQYESPNTSSYVCGYLPQEEHEELLKEMLVSWKKENYLFIPSNAKIHEINNCLEEKNLMGINLCSYCKRFVCRRKPKDRSGYRETDFECLMRHLRNALAHGRFFVIHGGNHISLLFDDRNEKGNITARIICNQADLKKWKKIIVNKTK